MEVFTKEWSDRKKESEDLRKEILFLAHTVSTMAESHEKDMKTIREECQELRTENKRLRSKVDRIEADVVKTKRTLKSEKKKGKDLCRMVESMKKIWIRILVLAHQTSHQTLTQPTPSAASSSANVTCSGLTLTSFPAPGKSSSLDGVNVTSSCLTLTSSPAPGRSLSLHGASATSSSLTLTSTPAPGRSSSLHSANVTSSDMTLTSPPAPVSSSPPGTSMTSSGLTSTSSPAPVRSQSLHGARVTCSGLTLTSSSAPLRSSSFPDTSLASMDPTMAKSPNSEERNRLKDASRFNVVITTRIPIQAGHSMALNGYNWVNVHSNFMHKENGTYRTPVEGGYEFCGYKRVYGKDDVDIYVCAGDGRREKMIGGSKKAEWWRYDGVVWECPEGMKVWLEIEGGEGCRHTTFQARFCGGLRD